jgi:hypothetical protein
MIHAPGAAHGAMARLVPALKARGLAITDAESPDLEGGATLLISTPVDWMRLGVWLAPWRVARGARIVVVSRVGAHPDARAAGLRDLWRLEEYARVSLIPTLTLRLAPLVSKQSPFWTQLAANPRLGAEARQLVMPVLEEDALGALERALREERPAEEWFEVVGPDARSLEEWAAIASRGGTPGTAVAGAWEPEIEELAEHRLCEPELWQERFAVRARSVIQWAGAA